MNKSDAERIENVLQLMGYRAVDHENDANIIGVVSCSVRQAAMDRVHGRITRWNEMKKSRPVITLLTGCVLPHDREQVGRKFDILLDLNDLRSLPQQVSMFEGFEVAGDASDFRADEFSDYFSFTPNYHERFRAFVPIMAGCDKFCTYCAVPYTRGRERSRSMVDILKEIRNLVVNGCLEVTLLGQNVNSYHPKDMENLSSSNPYNDAFAALLWELNQVQGLNRIHFTAPHPRDMSDEVIDAMALPKHVNYLHLPMQSGDDEILRKMNRKYTGDEFLQLVERVKRRIPGIALGTDIIVGFCGETEEQFQKTVDAYQRIEFDISYHAMYSPRVGTVSEKLWTDDVPRAEKKRRWGVLQNLMEDITLKKNQSYKGKVCEVLVDKYEKGFCTGMNREYKMVRFPSEIDRTGHIVHVTINDPKTWVLDGEPLNVLYGREKTQKRTTGSEAKKEKTRSTRGNTIHTAQANER